MQFLIFHLGKDRYGLSTHRVVRVLPLMEFKAVPHAPDYVAGILNYHGAPIPVIDLCMLACGKQCNAHFDTRIVLVDYLAQAGTSHLLGVIVEQVAGFQYIERDSFRSPGIALDAPYLGEISTSDGAILQLINIENLLSDAVRAILFPPSQREAT